MKVKYIKATPEAHERITGYLKMLLDEFQKAAKEAGIKIVKGKKYRNVPGMKEALDGLLNQEWGDLSLENRAFWQAQKLVGKEGQV